MTGKIKKLNVKESTGNFGDYIPLGADAVNIDLANGQNVEEVINYLSDESLRGEDLEEIADIIIP
jgi:hypothetical protein